MAEKSKVSESTEVANVVLPQGRQTLLTPAGTFGGFQIAYPEYTVITPQTLQSFTVRSLNVSEEENLKSSLLNPRKIAEHLNSIIFKSLVKKPDHIKTFEDFLTKITIKDREALVYGLYHVTYKDVHNYDITCSQCEAHYAITVKISDCFSMNLWPGEKDEVLCKELKLDLNIAKGISVILKQPTLKQELELMNNSLFVSEKSLEVGTETLIIDRFEVERPGAPKPEIITGKENIISGYQSLPSGDRKDITKAYMDTFGKYSLSLKAVSSCSCGNRNETNLDVAGQFFRAMYQ